MGESKQGFEAESQQRKHPDAAESRKRRTTNRRIRLQSCFTQNFSVQARRSGWSQVGTWRDANILQFRVPSRFHFSFNRFPPSRIYDFFLQGYVPGCILRSLFLQRCLYRTIHWERCPSFGLTCIVHPSQRIRRVQILLQIQQTAVQSQRALSISQQQTVAKDRDRRILQLTIDEISQIEQDVNLYKGVGKMCVMQGVSISLLISGYQVYASTPKNDGRWAEGPGEGTGRRYIKLE